MKKLISIVLSFALLGVIYWKVDISALGAALASTDHFWLVASLSMIVLLLAITAWRFLRLVPANIDFLEALRLTLAASTLNMVLPSKAGDLIKAYFMEQSGGVRGTLALSIVVFEKACDMLSLLLWCCFGLVLYHDKDPRFWIAALLVGALSIFLLLLLVSARFAARLFSAAAAIAPKRFERPLIELASTWTELHAFFWSDRARAMSVFAVSIGLWFLHLFQIWLFVRALGATVPFVTNLALAPLAIFAGLLPLTLAGIGTRDAALVLLYAPYIGAPAAAALGILCTTRYFLPALGGLPFLPRYFSRIGRRAHAH